MTSALEGADVFCHYHPSEEQDAKDTADYIKKVAPNAKVETYAKDLRTEKACLEMVEEVKKWSGSKLDILYVSVSSPLLSLASPRSSFRLRCPSYTYPHPPQIFLFISAVWCKI